MPRKANVTPDGLVSRDGRTFAQTQPVLAKQLGMSTALVRKHVSHPDCPGSTSADDYDIEAWRAFVKGLGRRKDGEENTEESFDAKLAKEELEKVKLEEQIRQLRLKNEKEEGNVIDVEEACRVFTELTAGFKSQLDAMKDRLSADLAGLPTPEAAKRIKEASRDVLNELALGSWAKKKAFWSRLYAIQSDLLKN